MKTIIFCAIIVTICTLSFANSPVGLTIRTRGDVSLSRNEQTDSLTDGKPLINNDVLRSYEDSFAFIKFIDDGAHIRLFENSILTINTDRVDEKMNKTTYLQVGILFTSVNKDKGELSVETPTTVASIKGTEGFVYVQEDGTTFVIVLRGSYDVYNKESQYTITVGAGNTCTSDPDGNIEYYPTEDIDIDWLKAAGESSLQDYDVYSIEVMDDNGNIRIIEIEVEKE